MDIDYIDPKGTIQLFDEEVFAIVGIRTDEFAQTCSFRPLCDTRGNGNCCRGPNRDVCNNDGNFDGQRYSRLFDLRDLAIIWGLAGF